MGGVDPATLIAALSGLAQGAAMIPISSGVRVGIATGHTDMRRGMNSLALQVQEALKRDPHGAPGASVAATSRCDFRLVFPYSPSPSYQSWQTRYPTNYLKLPNASPSLVDRERLKR
jgi:hypothetical protein